MPRRGSVLIRLNSHPIPHSVSRNLMASPRFDIISIGTLSRNILWNEPQPVRTPHATTTLVRVGKRNILVDPALPAIVLGARLLERAGLRPEQIDTVFLTNFRP